MTHVTVYSKPNCRACKVTKASLTKWGIEYEEIDVSLDDAARQRLMDQGFLALPVVETPIGTWSGLDEAKLVELVEHVEG